MSLQTYYEDSYRMERGRSTSELLSEETGLSKGLYHYVLECKDRFLTNYDWKGLRILELGSGRGGLSLLLARLGAKVTLVDFSPTAMEQARGMFELEHLELTAVTGDITHPDINIPGHYDLIIDSHLLHCLTGDPERSSYYRLISDHLLPHGIFVAESMVHRKKLYIPDGFMFDEQNVLWQMFGKWTPVRRILDSLELERELNEAQFKIAYFIYYAQFGFIPHRRFMDVPAEILPASVRLVAQLKAD